MASSSYEEFAQRTWDENLLFNALLELTYRCNLDCFYCYNDTSRDGRVLSLGQYYELLDDLRDLGALHVTLSGGEPLAHPQFFEIGAKARDLGFAVRIKSNGHALRGRLARRLLDEVEPIVVDLSLHGAVAATHDRQTRVPGSFDRLVANVQELLGLGFRLKLNCTLTAWNEGEIDGVAALGRKLGVTVSFNTTVSPRDDGDRSPLDIAPSRAGLFGLWDLLDRTTAAERPEVFAREGDALLPPNGSKKNCGAGSSNITVDPYGEVLPCVQWRRPVGNLHEEPLREIWRRSTRLREVRAITIAAKKTSDDLRSENGDSPSFCPGLAELSTGDPVAPYSTVVEHQRLTGEHAQRKRALLPIVD